MAEPIQVKFPPPKREAPVLALPRRRNATPHRPPTELLETTAAARESIHAIFGSSPGITAAPEPRQVLDLERTLRELELRLAERERVIDETESRLLERERDVAEAEALLTAREELLEASRKPAPAAEITPEEKAAIERVRAELERQEVTIREAKQSIRDREQFLDESEEKLFAKVQLQQEKENELEQLQEDLLLRERRLREREAIFDPAIAAALKSEEEAARKRDEFKE